MAHIFFIYLFFVINFWSPGFFLVFFEKSRSRGFSQKRRIFLAILFIYFFNYFSGLRDFFVLFWQQRVLPMLFLGKAKKGLGGVSKKRRATTICYWAWPAFGKFHLQFPPREEIKEEFSLNIFWHFLGDFFLGAFLLIRRKFFFFEDSYIVRILLFYCFHENIL